MYPSIVAILALKVTAIKIITNRAEKFTEHLVYRTARVVTAEQPRYSELTELKNKLGYEQIIL